MNQKKAELFEYFDHDADIGIIGRGETICEAFISVAKATFAIMADLDSLKQSKQIKIEFTEQDLDFALVTWLNLLLAIARTEQIMFCHFELQRHDDKWLGYAAGETWQQSMVHGTEVKGATLTGLSVKKTNHLWQATCIVDV